MLASAVVPVVAGATADLFQHGVASGDPLPDGILLWTRVITNEPVEWEVSADSSFSKIVASGVTASRPERDHTVKVEVCGLRPGTRYWYRFRAGSAVSPTGRTKTAPVDCSELRFGMAACANYLAGYFTSYGYLASRDDLDAIIHLGDYVYEVHDPGVRVHEPPHECVTLADYRARHAQYKTDPHLRALHAAHPFIVTWDDHESADNSSSIGSPSHDPATEGPWAVRLAAATRAYFEWMPIREGRVQRRLRFGRLADLTLLDLRSYRTADTILGASQRDWLVRGLTDRSARWRLVANSVMLAPLQIPPGIGQPPVNTDQWDGFPVDRDVVLKALDRAGERNAVFLTGDIHSSWAINVPLDAKPVATEFVATSVTSHNFDDLAKVPPRTVALQVEAKFRELNPHVKFVELDSHGVCVLTANRDEVRVDWHYVANKLDPNAAVAPAHSYRTRHDTATVEPML